jgi:hypothetical protein
MRSDNAANTQMQYPSDRTQRCQQTLQARASGCGRKTERRSVRIGSLLRGQRSCCGEQSYCNSVPSPPRKKKAELLGEQSGSGSIWSDWSGPKYVVCRAIPEGGGFKFPGELSEGPRRLVSLFKVSRVIHSTSRNSPADLTVLLGWYLTAYKEWYVSYWAAVHGAKWVA